MNDKILDLIAKQKLSIVEVTESCVVPSYLLDEPDDPESYVDDSSSDIMLEIRRPDGKAICRGDQYDVIEFLKSEVQTAGDNDDAQ